mmetsp:Transcript_22599/g.90575  ORF Transcript_22599/g.90575 Transcript_22599/m.90575 type:complete len:402 (-) Transcript_22599:1797-3002(-)
MARKRTATRMLAKQVASDRKQGAVESKFGEILSLSGRKEEPVGLGSALDPLNWTAGGDDLMSDGPSGDVVEKVLFSGKVLSTVRWLESGSSAVVGSAEGEPGEDFVRIYEDGENGIDLKHECVHPGKVFDLEVTIGDRNSVLCASSDGTVRLYLNSKSAMERVGAFPRGEAAAGVAALSERAAAGAGSEGSIAVMDIETGVASAERAGGDGIGIRAASRLTSDDFATAGISGFVSLWDCRQGLSAPSQRLRYPRSRAALLCIDADRAQTHYVFCGTDMGEVVCWDRRKEEFPVSSTAPHNGQVWDVRVVNSRPGMLLSCGEDGSVLSWDFLQAAQRGVGAEEYWTAEMTAAELKQLALGKTLGVNAVDVHEKGDLVAYATDSSTLCFTSLTNSQRLAPIEE